MAIETVTQESVIEKSFSQPSAGINLTATRRATIRLLRILMAATLLLPVLLFASAAWINRQNIHALADERIQRSLDVLQEQSLRVFQSLNVTFLAVNNLLGDRSDDEIGREQSQLHDQLSQIVSQLPEVQSIWVFDRTGRVQVTSTVFPAPAAREYDQEDYIRVHRDGYVGTYVGGHHDSKFGGHQFLPVSRARQNTNGIFQGVVEISILPENFRQFYARLISTGGLQYAIIREDGLILTRYPELSAGNVRLDERSGFARTIVANPSGGFYTTTSQVDQIERRFGIRRLPGYPLYLSAGIATSEMQMKWLTTMGAHLIFGIPATLFLLGALADVLRRTKRLYAEQDRRQAAEGAVRQAQKMEAVGQLTGGIAHDFNNLLMVIIGNLETIERLFTKTLETADWKRLDRSINSAMHGARRAAMLTQRLLAFSRRQTLRPEPLDVNRLVNDLSEFLDRSIGEMISLEVVGAAGLWTLEADHAQMEAAMVNLVINARDAMPGGGKLTIETSNAYLDDAYCLQTTDARPGQYVLISVTDTGTGMPKETVDRAFEPFFTTKPPGGGTGLGLSQVYGFVKQSGGHLRIYSELGHGTTVKIYLPRAISKLAFEDKVPPRAIVGAGFGERVLVVEDDSDVRAYVVEMLSELKYQVHEATDGERALALCEHHTFDLLLTDVVLPGMNGKQLADKLKLRQSRLKVLFMTGYSRNAIIHQGRLDPSVSMVQKPVAASELAGKIRELLSEE